VAAATGLSALLTGNVAQAHPFASGINVTGGATTNVSFTMNEAGAAVIVTFDDSSTLDMGVLPVGRTNFVLSPHAGYSISASKAGNGLPVQITSDANTNSQWANPRGIDTFRNPKYGSLFGRLVAGSAGPGGIAFGNPVFKGHGLYEYYADQTDATGQGTNATATSIFAPAGSGGAGPWRIRTKQDDYTVWVTDESLPNAGLWVFAPDLSTNAQILAFLGDSAGRASGVHGRVCSVFATGSLATGDLKVWTADNSLPTPSAASCVKGPGTGPSSLNCVFRYDIGAGPLPWNQIPNYSYTMGLDGLALNLNTEMTIGNDGKLWAVFGLANGSNPNLQILDTTYTNLLWTSWDELPNGGPAGNPPYDPWAGINGAGAAVGTYGGARVSHDGKYIASQDIQNGITIANLTNGIPNDGSIFGISNAPSTTNGRGLCWDAADNIWVTSNGQLLLRCYSLGITTTCVTSNDFTGTNGSFAIVTPGATATLAVPTPTASQNYVNNPSGNNPGTPIPGVFRVDLNVSSNPAPVSVAIVLGGTATLGTQYTINTGVNADGVTIATTSATAGTVTFPAGQYPHAGNWSASVIVTPTATPLSGPTTVASLKLVGGVNYAAGSPGNGNIAILNTGPQLLALSASAGNANMSRGIPNDYCRLILTRTGDTNGPGNDSLSVSAKPYQVTNFNYYGTAKYPLDFTALAQVQYPTPPYGNLSTLTNGGNRVDIPAGATTVTVVLGNPVKHTNVTQTPTNLTIIVNATNTVTPGTNCTSIEGYAYAVTPAAVTVNELDNTIGKDQVVIWSNPLTNAADSINWTLTHARIGFATNPVPPTVIPNYSNNCVDQFTANLSSNDFIVAFGKNIADDGVPASDAMAQNGWSKGLKMTVNKLYGTEAGVNVYPNNVNLQGNYALRFDMYLSIYQYATNANNSVANIAAREYAAFGINHYGTNCNWRLDVNPRILGTGAGPTNSDGAWCAIDAGWNAITPADFDMFVSPAIPNHQNTVTNGAAFKDQVSNTALSQAGVFKHPPFNAIGPDKAGEPVNQWLNVSFEVTQSTNLSLFMAGQKVLASYGLTNNAYGGLANELHDGAYIRGLPMLGYLDPNASFGDIDSSFVMFSNVRAVELAPYVTQQPGQLRSATVLSNGFILAQGSSLTITSSASFCQLPGITNIWYRGRTPVNAFTATNWTFALQTNSVNATNMTDALTITANSAADGTNYMCVFTDTAGSATSMVAQVTVVLGPTNQALRAWSTNAMIVAAAGPLAPTAFQWYFNAASSNFAGATKLVNSSHYAGVTTTALTMTNIAFSDGGYYWCAVTNASGGVVTAAGILSVTEQPYSITSVANAGANTAITFNSGNSFDTSSAFILQAAGLVVGPYTNTSATISGSNPFTVNAPKIGDQMFYRIVHK